MGKPLTDVAIREIKPTEKRREVPVGGATGLVLVVQPGGGKQFAMRFRRPDGRLAKLSLGPLAAKGYKASSDPEFGKPLTLAAARALAGTVNLQRSQGIDVVGERTAARLGDANTFGAAALRFVDEYAKRHQRRWMETARLLGFDPDLSLRPSGLAARWSERPVGEINGNDLYGVVDECRRKGIPGTKRRKSGILDSQGRAMAAALSKLFGWMTEHRLVTTNPALGLYKPPQAAARDRVLADDELRRFWAATDEIGLPFGPLLKLMLLTGQRESEVGGMRRDELSEDFATWTLPSDRTKNRRAHVVPLPPLARDILTAVPAVLVNGKEGIASPFVFTTTRASPVSGFSKAKARVDALMKPASPWRFHDLRRTVVTQMAELGVQPHVIEAVVNHVSGHKGGIAGVYNRATYLPEKKAALERWAEHVEGLVSGRAAKVVPLRA